MPYRETGNLAYKQLCLLWNSAIWRMTKIAHLVKMVEMKRLFPICLIGVGILILLGSAGVWGYNQKVQHPSSAPLPYFFSPFSPVGERQDGTRIVYELDGMGQKHFYFQSGKMIVWLAVNPERAEEALTQVLKFYP